MRMLTAAALGGLMVAATAAVTPAQDGRLRGAEVIAQARQALGGDGNDLVKALSLRAAYRRDGPLPGGGGGMRIVMVGPGGPGDGEQTGDLEIDLALPDRYIRVDTGTGGLAMTRTEGFDGTRPFLDLSSNQPGVRLMAPPPPADEAAKLASLRRLQGDLSRLLLGILATTPETFPTTFVYAGRAESPEGQADMLDVSGPDGFAARLFVDADSHLPLMLTWQAPEPRIVMRTATDDGPPPAPGTGRQGGPPRDPSEAERDEVENTAAADLPAKMQEHRLFFDDFREVGGVRLPHHITRGTADKTIEEWQVKTYRLNPTFKADRFKVGAQ